MSVQYTNRKPATVLGLAAGLATVFNGTGSLEFFQAIFVSSATVGNRQLTLRVKDAAGNQLFEMPAGNVQPASTTRTYSWIEGVTQRETTVTANHLVCPWPEVIIPSGGSVSLVDTADIDHVADTAATSYTFEEYP